MKHRKPQLLNTKRDHYLTVKHLTINATEDKKNGMIAGRMGVASSSDTTQNARAFSRAHSDEVERAGAEELPHGGGDHLPGWALGARCTRLHCPCLSNMPHQKLGKAIILMKK